MMGESRKKRFIFEASDFSSDTEVENKILEDMYIKLDFLEPGCGFQQFEKDFIWRNHSINNQSHLGFTSKSELEEHFTKQAIQNILNAASTSIAQRKVLTTIQDMPLIAMYFKSLISQLEAMFELINSSMDAHEVYNQLVDRLEIFNESLLNLKNYRSNVDDKLLKLSNHQFEVINAVSTSLDNHFAELTMVRSKNRDMLQDDLTAYKELVCGLKSLLQQTINQNEKEVWLAINKEKEKLYIARVAELLEIDNKTARVLTEASSQVIAGFPDLLVTGAMKAGDADMHYRFNTVSLNSTLNVIKKKGKIYGIATNHCVMEPFEPDSVDGMPTSKASLCVTQFELDVKKKQWRLINSQTNDELIGMAYLGKKLTIDNVATYVNKPSQPISLFEKNKKNNQAIGIKPNFFSRHRHLIYMVSIGVGIAAASALIAGILLSPLGWGIVGTAALGSIGATIGTSIFSPMALGLGIIGVMSVAATVKIAMNNWWELKKKPRLPDIELEDFAAPKQIKLNKEQPSIERSVITPINREKLKMKMVKEDVNRYLQTTTDTVDAKYAADIEMVIALIEKNIHFFSAPFVDKKNFDAWIKYIKQEANPFFLELYEALSPSKTQIWNIPNSFLLEFEDSLKNNMRTGDSTSLRELIRKNNYKRTVDELSLCEVLVKHINNPIINNNWYLYQLSMTESGNQPSAYGNLHIFNHARQPDAVSNESIPMDKMTP